MSEKDQAASYQGLLESMDEYIKSHCYSVYDGCACHKLKDHEDLHECPSPMCDGRTWTTEQAREWLEQIKAEYE